MGNITSFALGKTRLTAVLILLIIAVGLWQFSIFPRQEDPPIVIREAVVTAFFPGMAPEQMEELVTRKIEEQIRGMPEIDEITSDTKTGIAIIHAETRDEYDDLLEIWKRLRNKMDDISAELPDGTYGPYVNDEFGLTAIATIALWSDGFSMAEMRPVARDIRDRLYELKGIRKVELHGVQEEKVYLKFSNTKLSQFGISAMQVVETLVAQNVVLPGGHIDTDGRDIIMSPSGSFDDVNDIADTLIAVPGTQNMVRLSDLVSIERGYADPPRSLAYFNGRPSIVVAVSIVPGVNSVEFGERLTKKLEQLENNLPVGYVLEYATYQPDLVVAAVDGALSNVYQTLGIVLAVVILFLGLRTGMIVGSFVPITMLMGLIIMRRFDIELERVSIVSAIVALGMLVDNAIVVAEDIRSRLERGQERRAACIDSGKTLAVPLLTSSLTTILAFLPMLLLKGQTGEYAYSLPMVVIILLLGSWFLSMYMTPAMAFWFMKVERPENQREPESESEATDPYGSKAYRTYRSYLQKTLQRKGMTIAVTLGLLVSAGWGSTFLVREFFGTSDRNQFLVYLDMPAGYRITATDRSVQEFTSWLSDEEINPEVTSSIAYVGTGGPRFFLTLSPVDPDPHVAFLTVNTAEPDQVAEVVARVKAHLADNYPDVNSRVKRMWLGANEPGLVEFRLVGPDVDHLFVKSKTLVDALWKMPGIDYVQNDWENKVPRVDVVVDQVRARRAGVTSREVAMSLNAFLDGATLTDFREGDLSIPVVIQAEDEEREALGDLWNINVHSASRGVNVPLTQIADIRGEWQFSRIARKDQERTITISTRHTSLKAPQVLEQMTSVLDGLDLAPGHRWEIGGEIETSAETNGKLFGSMPVCILGIVVLLIWQFNSVRRPLIIMLTIPMAFAGALVGLLIMSAPFDFFGILGLLSLAGVIINNGIVLIDRIDTERESSTGLEAAIVAAAIARARPILMSAVTTLLGVAPLILFRDPLFFSMACVIAFGLALGTVLTLFVVPVLYSLFFRAKSAVTA